MQETYTLIVKTDGGKLLTEIKTIQDLFSLSFTLSRLSHAFLHHAEEIEKSRIMLGGGITPYASVSSSSTVR